MCVCVCLLVLQWNGLIEKTTKSIQSFFSLIYVMDMLYDCECCLVHFCFESNGCWWKYALHSRLISFYTKQKTSAGMNQLLVVKVTTHIIQQQQQHSTSFAYINYDLKSCKMQCAKRANNQLRNAHLPDRKQTPNAIVTECTHRETGFVFYTPVERIQRNLIHWIRNGIYFQCNDIYRKSLTT